MRRYVTRWLAPMLATLGTIVGLLWLSGALAGRPYQLGAYTSIQFVLNTNAAALASTLGILMAIVLLVVQLTAQRYSFNVIGMFVGDPRNIAMVILFIGTIGFNLWLAATVDDGYIPTLGVYVALGLTTLCFGLLIPYFAYLFEALTPQRLLDRLREETLEAVYRAGRDSEMEGARTEAYARIHQIGDIMRTALTLGDGDVAARSVWTLQAVLSSYLDHKRSLPDEWFSVEEDLVGRRHALVSQEVERSRTWFERHALEEIQAAFSGSLNRYDQVNTAIALSCRLLGERMLVAEHDSAFHVLLKFFNTLLRAALNASDGRTGYHLLYQYELLAEAAFARRPGLVAEIAHRIAYYGTTSIGLNVPWVAAAAAHDLRTLVAAASRGALDDEIVRRVQDELLGLLRAAEAAGSPVAPLLLKSAIVVGAFHVSRDDGEMAEAVAAGLRHHPPAQLSALVAELEAVTDPEFWELTDRLINFDYVDDGPRARLREFLGRMAEPAVDGAGPAARAPEALAHPREREVQ